jgi:cob(I)alamin adenosyltransferase
MEVRNKLGNRGEVILFIGPGRGKTATALGIALRAITYGGKVVFIHFSGPQYPELGEVKAAAVLGDNLRMVGIRSEASNPSYLNDFHETVNTVADALAMARNVWIKQCNLLVLDDIGHQLDQGRVDIAQVLALIEDRPPNLSIILTGRAAPEKLVKTADLVTEFVDVKQPSPSRVRLHKGIDF